MIRKLEKYEILEEIGHGGMATVYRARDSRLDRRVAIKIMHPHLRGAHEARVRFAREAKSVARLHHDNILEIYDNSDPDSEEAYIVTELLTGPTLKQFADDHRDMPAEVAACFGVLIARALDCAHTAGIVHRDVKPENVILHDDRTVKLTDFGIAQMIDSHSFTATGQILGSPGHMAPEQIETGNSDQRTDIFALGTVLYFLATGCLPFEGRNPHQMLKRIVDANYAHPLRVRPTLGGRFSKIIERALEKKPDDRYQSAGEMEEALTAFVAEVGIDDPADYLGAYLKDSEGTTLALREATLPALIARGRDAATRGDVPVALDCYNRVLALDDGNEEVLALIERIGHRDRNKTVMLIASSLVAMGAVIAVAYGWTGGGASNHPVEDAGAVAAVAGDAAVDADGAGPDGSQAATDAGALVRGPDAGAPDAAVALTPTGVVTKIRPPVLRTPRLVRFLPSPRDVELAVGAGEFQPFGPSSSEVQLIPGRYRLRMRGRCCAELDDTFTVSPGPADEPVLVRRALALRPARIYVTANVAGDVSVNGEGMGRTNQFIEVPMDRPAAQARISVTSPGYQAYTGTRRLQAGGETRVAATLIEASGSTP
ncbi:MAG: serine/threonine protein kinase [Deltaproteobacteria bacterium]|nr:serine/threonine protein kinase [Deltaproteobacteria bacterium]